jgi:8-oxo-dGTP pyrophosphatase MutT (NUDIX family)
VNNKINHKPSDNGNYQKVPTPAASVLLIRDTNQQIEVFMIKRSMKTNFGGVWVFPGGKIDDEDISNDYLKYSPHFDDGLASERLGLKKDGLSYWTASIRECFEESGILLANKKGENLKNTVLNNDDLKIIDQYKNKILQGENTFYEMIDILNLELATNELAYISHWVTPKIEKRRYSTRFFIARSTDQVAVHDGVEGVESKWINPEEAIQECKSGNFPMIMPTIKNLEMICGYTNSSELLSAMNNKGKDDIPNVEPVFKIVDGEPKLIRY